MTVLLSTCVSLVMIHDIRSNEDLILRYPFVDRPPAVQLSGFVKLDPEVTGVKALNHYEDPRIWTERYHEFSVGAIGTGVAVGDYDNDGRPDVFVVCKTEPSRLFRNMGDFRFEDVTERAGLLATGASAKEWKQGCAWVDVNNDGLLDLFHFRFASPNQLFMNLGNGRFREEAGARGVALVDASGMGTFADYDRDGDLDFYLQTNVLDVKRSSGGQADYLFSNDGNGYFKDVTQASGIKGVSQGHAAIWWDFNEDRWPDIYVANDFGVPDRLYQNNGDGTFREVARDVLPSMPTLAMGADFGDVDGDGHEDLFVGDMARRTHEGEQRTIADTRSRTRVGPGDRAPQIMRNMLYLNAGGGVIREAAWLAGIQATNWTWSARFEDLDHDGWLDLHVTNGMVREYDNVDLRQRAMSAENPAERVRIMRASPELIERNVVFRNTGHLRFEDWSDEWNLGELAVSFGAAFGDFDGDGDLDLIHANYRDHPSVYRNDAARGNSVIFSLRGRESNRFGIGARVEVEAGGRVQVRTLASARGYLSTSETVLHFGLGDSEKIERVTIHWPSGTEQSIRGLTAGARYLVHEKADDAFSQPCAPAPIFERSVLRPRDASREQADVDGGDPLQSWGTGRKGPVAVALKTLHGVRWMIPVANPGEPVLSAVQPGSPLPPSSELDWVAIDLEGDGEDELVSVASAPTLPAGDAHYHPVIWSVVDERIQKIGTIEGWAAPTGAIVSADFNSDGRADLFIGGRVSPGEYPLSPPSALYLNSPQGFVHAAAGLDELRRVTAARSADMDGDGDIDLIVAEEWGHVRVLENDGTAIFADATQHYGFDRAGTGLWRSLAVIDANKDGRPDVIAGNQGLNSRYTASEEAPVSLYSIKTSKAARPRLLESYFQGGEEYSFLTRQQLSSIHPSLTKPFGTNDEFARATLDQIVPRSMRDASATLRVTNLNSGIFLSGPGGRYYFNPLPRTAQLSPAQGLLPGDFDRDGVADLWINQNSHDVKPWVGRFSGGVGQLLLGRGDGSFKEIAPQQAGIWHHGEGRSAIGGDFDGDGDLDVLITEADGTVTLATNNNP